MLLLQTPREKNIWINFLGILIAFISFNLGNLILFYNIKYKVFYFPIAIFLFCKVYLKFTNFYIHKFISQKKNIKTLKKRQAFKLFSILYFIAYIGARYSPNGIEDILFVSYL